MEREAVVMKQRPCGKGSSAGALVLVCAMLAAPLWGEIRREESRWVRQESGVAAMSQNESLRVAAGGEVTLRGGAPGELRYQVRLAVREENREQAERALKAAQITLTRQGGTLLLTVATPPARFEEQRVDVMVPPQFGQASVETAGGGVTATGFTAQLMARTAGGRLEFDRIRGPVRVETAGGLVKFGRVQGSVYCLSGGGRIEVGQVEGDAVLETGGGDIEVGAVTGELRASTNGGNISLSRGGAGVKLRTGGGEIRVGEAAGEVVAETGGGGIKVTAARGVKAESAGGSIVLEEVQGPIRAVTAAGSITARLARLAAPEESTLSTAAGDITVYIPPGLPLRLRARAAGSRARIYSEFEEFAPPRALQWAAGRKEVSGTLAGGGPLVTLAATEGTISLRKRR